MLLAIAGGETRANFPPFNIESSSTGFYRLKDATITTGKEGLTLIQPL
jgi:hypothetical protein